MNKINQKRNYLKNNVKRIGIDARFYGPVGKGLGRYTKEVVDRILETTRIREVSKDIGTYWLEDDEITMSFNNNLDHLRIFLHEFAHRVQVFNHPMKN